MTPSKREDLATIASSLKFKNVPVVINIEEASDHAVQMKFKRSQTNANSRYRKKNNNI